MTQDQKIEPMLYIITATLTGQDEGKKISFDVHQYMIIPSSISESEVETVLRKQIDLDENDKLTFRQVKVGETFQFLGYDNNQKMEEGLKEGDVFTFKKCGYYPNNRGGLDQYVETFEKAPQNEGMGWFFRPSEIGKFPPPENPFFEEEKKS